MAKKVVKKTRRVPLGAKTLRIMKEYCDGVLDESIPSCMWVKLACKRFQRDLESSATEDFPYAFDAAKAARVLKFVELLPHVKGKWARKKDDDPNAHRLRMEPFQVFIIGNIFGWVHKRTGARRFRKASYYVPRKNAKSTLAAAIGHWMAWKDDEPGAEVYSGATTEKQAWEVFGPARLMVKNEPDMAEGLDIEIAQQRLFRLTDGSKFQPIIGKPGDGASPHCSITDEYHEHDTADQYETMLTGMGAREQPLALIISTAGDNLAGPCYEDWQYVQKVLQGIIVDETTFGIIYTVDPEDDWTTEIALRKANPNYGVSVGSEFLLQQQQDAINSARKQGVFKTKHLNVWVQARNAYINMEKWRSCSVKGSRLSDFHGRRCIIGLDLASKVDIAAVELVFPGEGKRYHRFGKYYLPEATVELPENEHYRAWRDDGWLTVTEGNIIDFTRILNDIIAMCSEFQVENVAYDPHQATMLVTELMREGIPCVEMRPTVLNFSEPMKTIEGLIRDQRLHHNDDPVMTWMMSNVVASTDAKDNVYPRKERAENKIDGFVALVMAFALLILPDEDGDEEGFFKNPVRA